MKIEKNYDFKKIENEVHALWKRIKLLELWQKQNAKGEKYFLLDGPPYANYVPHVGHIRNTVFKDMYIRIAFQEGRNVFFQPGFDTHGLPIENMVEKKLKLTSKKDIQKMGIRKFMKECRDSAALNKDLWLEAYRNLGSVYAWNDPYLTYENSYIESTWWSFKQLWDKGQTYEGKRPVFWCPKCETALAGYEATDSYKNVSDPSVIVRFKVKGTQDDYLLVFTTTPWTLPANAAIAVKSDEDYVKVKTEQWDNLILAKNCLKLLDQIKVKYDIIETFKGVKLDGMKYESLLDVPCQKELQNNPNALRVYLSIPILKERVASKVGAKKGITTGDVFEDFVTVEDGTGMVHTAPGHGKTDNMVGLHYKIPEISPLDDECKFTDEAGKYQGMFVKDADHVIAEDMHQQKKLVHFSRIEHSYPLCWRCKAPLIFRMSNQWFLKIDPVREKMLKANEEVNWQPEFARDRFRDWVANAEDWNFSRQRYWGIPIPIWKCECGDMKAIGSVEELNKDAVKKVDEKFDLHTVNDVKLKCKCGKEMTRINEIFDVWYDSGSSPYAAMGYPFKNKELFESHFPVDRINESQDQVRGWFYSLMFCGISVFGKAPYKTVSMPGWVVDKMGDKMSKSVGNVVFAKDALNDFGADALRFYYCWDIAAYSLQKFNTETIKTEVSKLFNILWNLHNFVLNHGEQMKEPKTEKIEDKWILSRLNSVIGSARTNLASYEIHLAGRNIYDFILNDLSRSYVQIIRDRLEYDLNPIYLINYCLKKMVTLMAPISPFVTEQIYQDLKQVNDGLKESVHLELLPDAGKSDENLENEMKAVFDIMGAVLSARDKRQLGVRWPLQKVVVDTADKTVVKALTDLKELFLKQVNIKDVKFESFKVNLKIKPNYRNLGKAFGQETADVIGAIKEAENAIVKELEAGKEEFSVGKYKIKKDHLEITKETSEDFEMAEFKSGCVFIETHLTPELEAEGFAREVMRRVQQLRKKADLHKSNMIKLAVETDMHDTLGKFADEIKGKVGAEEILIVEKSDKKYAYISEEKVKGRVFKILLEKV